MKTVQNRVNLTRQQYPVSIKAFVKYASNFVLYGIVKEQSRFLCALVFGQFEFRVAPGVSLHVLRLR